MKTFKTFCYFVVLVLFAGVFSFCGCKDDDHDDDDGHVHQHLMLKFHEHVGDTELVLNQPFTSLGGVKFTISRINYYLSGLKMQVDHGGVYQNYDDVYILVNESTDEVELGEIPAGSMHGLEFAIGIEDSAVNHSDPGSYEASHPLSPKSPSMNWGWATGYRFFVVEGQVDTDNDGTVDSTMQLHIGTDMNLAHHDSHHHFTVTEGTDVTLNVELDLLKVFEGIDLATEYITHSMGGAADSLAVKVAANLPDAFTVE